MHQKIRQRFDRLEAVRQRIEARIDGVAPATLNRQPEPGRWSAAQVISHIVKAESLSISYIGKKASDPSQLKPARLKQSLKSVLIVGLMWVPLKFRAPEVVAEVPENENPIELRDRWQRLRSEMRALLDAIPDELLGTCLYKHPIAGPMTLGAALEFMIAHATRHAKQIDRVLTALDS